MCSEWTPYGQIHCEYPINQWTLSSIYDQQVSALESQHQTYIEEDTKHFYTPNVVNTEIHASRLTPLPRTNSFESYVSQQSHLSGENHESPTPSFFSETHQHSGFAVPQPALSTATFQSSPSPSETVSHVSPPTKRRRGRPRLRSPDGDDVLETLDGKPRRTRLPHNQVERKYRQGLNSELERLRKTIPTLPQRSAGDINAPPRPSKATVLASAITYIQAIEAERDKLLHEVETLRASQTTESLNSRRRCHGCSEGSNGNQALTHAVR